MCASVEGLAKKGFCFLIDVFPFSSWSDHFLDCFYGHASGPDPNELIEKIPYLSVREFNVIVLCQRMDKPQPHLGLYSMIKERQRRHHLCRK